MHLIDGLGRGGAEQLLVAYAPELKRIGYDVQVVVFQEKDGNLQAARLRSAGIAVTLLRIDKLKRVDQLWRAVRGLRLMRPDLVHAHLQFASITAGLARRLLGVPAVATLHTLEHPTGLDRSSWRLWLMNRALATSVDRVICLSRASAEAARRIGLGEAQLEILGNGIDLRPYDAPPVLGRAAARARFGIAQDAPLILTVAVLRPEKGIDRLVAAMPAICSACPDVHLLVVGDGPQFAPLQAQIAGLRLGEAVTLTGFRDDVPDLMRSADIFVLPTLGDALPTVVMEAMAARLPVVASDVGGLSDMIIHGVEGVLVPPDDVPALAAAVLGLLLDGRARAQMGLAARSRAERDFTLQGQVARLAEIYEQLIADKRARR
ncbi:MAG: glycosyltransferase family 4 protein [Pseudorhodobacter sp.]|nr:glycosyltransferase family 4 protein [Pseudorhodobacter sp.]